MFVTLQSSRTPLKAGRVIRLSGSTVDIVSQVLREIAERPTTRQPSRR